MEVFTATIRRLAERVDVEITDETVLTDIGEIDSMRLLEAVALTEAAFEVQIDTSGLDEMATAGNVVDAVMAALVPAS